jgi:putative membrane protein
MFEVIISVVIGCLLGVVTGLIPGLHTNTIALILMGGLLSGWLNLSETLFVSGAVCMLVVHSFVDYIPSIFLGAPNSDTALSVLPGHRLLLKGEGYIALRETVVGGINSFLIGIPFLILFGWFIQNWLSFIKLFVAPVLLILTTWLILSETSLKKIYWAMLIFIFAGVLGLLTLNTSIVKDPLFPLLSGFFGLSILLFSMGEKSHVPDQKISGSFKLFSKENTFLGFISLFASSLMVLFPSLGPTQSATVAQAVMKNSSQKKFLNVMGGINTLDVLFTLVMLYLVGSARSGVLVAVQQLFEVTFDIFLIMLISLVIGLGFGTIACLYIGKRVGTLVSKLNYKLVSISVIVFLCCMVFIISGSWGLFLMSVSTSIGLVSQIIGVKKVHAMGVLTIPTILNFS